MPFKAKYETLDQLELFRPPPSRPLWAALPDDVRNDVRDLLAQMLKEYVERSVERSREEVDDD